MKLSQLVGIVPSERRAEVDEAAGLAANAQREADRLAAQAVKVAEDADRKLKEAEAKAASWEKLRTELVSGLHQEFDEFRSQADEAFAMDGSVTPWRTRGLARMLLRGGMTSDATAGSIDSWFAMDASFRALGSADPKFGALWELHRAVNRRLAYLVKELNDEELIPELDEIEVRVWGGVILRLQELAGEA